MPISQNCNLITIKKIQFLNINCLQIRLMNKPLFEGQTGQQNFISIPISADNVQKKARPKFTILDDIDQINQIINGPGANQQNQKVQQILQKTYQYMKGNEANSLKSNQSHELTNHRSIGIQKNQNLKIDDINKQNKDYINASKNQDCLQQKLKLVKGPRIIISMKKIDLTKQPTPSQFYVKGLQNLVSPQEAYGGTRAPRNSVLQSEKVQDGNLFTKALYTQRNKNHQINSLNVKPNRQILQPSKK